MKVEKQTLAFLKKLKQNNNRDWFSEHKPEFTVVQDQAKAFYSEVRNRLEKHDEIDQFKLYRIYRDVRFSKDKTPYQPHFAGSFSRLGDALRGSYYIRIRPGETFVAGGFWQPNKEDLLRIRQEIDIDDSEIREILANKDYQKYFGTSFDGAELKSAPRGFDKQHKAVDLLRKKGFIATRHFTDKEVLSNNFIEEVSNSFKALRPFFDLFSDILTTDLNGESIIVK